MEGLAKSIAWDGEGATCLIEVSHDSTDSISNVFIHGTYRMTLPSNTICRSPLVGLITKQKQQNLLVLLHLLLL